MKVELLRERLESYHCQNSREEEQAVREITQELILAGLSRTDLFSRAAFQGGTCLRIVHGVLRFSEDLDFALCGPNPAFRWDSYGKAISRELSAYGYEIELKEGRAEDGRAVKNAILRDDAITKLLNFEYLGKAGVPKKIQIRLDVDTNPPEYAWHNGVELNFPYHFPIVVDDPATLFAGKLAALLCRPYEKGRDWYDFLWNVAKRNPINAPHLEAALRQIGPWKGQWLQVSERWLQDTLHERIDRIDWTAMRADILKFVRDEERSSVEAWAPETFLAAARHLEERRLLRERPGKV
jgi:hypothetical protein